MGLIGLLPRVKRSGWRSKKRLQRSAHPDYIGANMKRLLTAFIVTTLLLPFAFGQSDYKRTLNDKLWRADDPRTANPINLYHGRNPLNPANKYRGDNDFNPANKFKFDNPLNPANRFKFGNRLNPTNRFHRDSPLNPVNRFRSPDDPPKDDYNLDYGLDDLFDDSWGLSP